MRFSGFGELLSYWARKAPDRAALVYERGGAPIACTFSQLQ